MITTLKKGLSKAHAWRNPRRILAACAFALAIPQAAHAQDYTLGTLFPMSGPNAEAGAIYTNAVDLALRHIRQDKWLQGEIQAKPVDSLGTPQGGAVGMSRLANVEKVPYALIGFTGVAKASAPIGDRARIMMVNGGAVGPDLATLSKYFWNIIPLANQEVEYLIPWLGEQNIKSIAVIYVDDPLGQGVLEQLKRGLPNVGGSVQSAYSVPPDLQQFAPIIARIRNDKPDAVYIASPNITQIGHIIKQVRDGGLKTPLLTYGAANFPSVSKLPESDGLVFTSQAADWASSEPAMKRFVDDWRANYKTEPTTYGLNYYNGALLYGYLLRGLEREGKPVTGPNLIAMLNQVGVFELAGGKAAFKDSTVSTAMQINRIDKGVPVKVR